MAKFRFNHFIDIHWNGYEIVGDAGTIFSIPDQLYEEFEGDLRPVEPSLEWTDTNEFQTLTNSVAASTITGLAPIVATATSTGKQISISSATAPDGYVLTADGSGGAAFEFSPGGGGGVAVVGTSPISVLTASGTATVSLNANYSTTSHLHDSDYVKVGGDTMSGQLYVSSATTTSTVGFGEIVVAKGTSYGSFTVNAADDHIHIRSKNPIEVLDQSGPTMQGLRARGLGVNSSHTYPTLIDDGITFGEDANLYRVSANALKTDDALEVVGSLTNGGTSVSLSTHTHAYQPAGTYVTAVNGTAPIAASTDTAGIVSVSLSASYSSSTHTHALPPTGSILMWPTVTAPTGWLFLDGSTYSQATYPDLAAVFGVVSGTFTLPDMRDRFVGGLAAVGALTNNAGTFAPDTANIHTHTTDIAHGHADTFSIPNHASHTHSVNPASTASGGPSATTTITYAGGGNTAVPGSGLHTHSTDIAATTSGAGSTTQTHDISGSVTSLGATSVTSSNGSLTPKSTLLNFIIKA